MTEENSTRNEEADAAVRTEAASLSAIPADELARITDDIVAALKTVYDPEIPAAQEMHIEMH